MTVPESMQQTKPRVTSPACAGGEQRFTVRDIRIFNPLLVEDIWETLTGSTEPGESRGVVANHRGV